MTKPNLPLAIIIFTVLTALAHLSLALAPRFDPIFLANALGYVVLMVLYFKWIKIPFLAGQGKIIWYAYMGFAAVTIVAYFLVNMSPFTNPFGLATKVIEAFLVLSLWQNKAN